MVGAGFSRNAVPGPLVVGGTGMPVWSGLTNALYDDLHPLQPGLDEKAKAERRHKAELRTHGVGAAMRLADEYEALRGRTALDQLMLRAIPDTAYEPGPAHRLLCSLPWADILTTNYDTLIERTLSGVMERRYDVVQAPEDLPGAIRPRVVKLHGGFPSSRPFVITEEDFRVYEARAAAFVNLARQAFVETTVCLLGFSGDDPNFLRWSGWTRDVLGSTRVNPIYLCGVLDLTASQRALLRKRHVLPIDLSPLFPPDRWPDRDLRMAAATEWLLLALEAGRPIDLSNWPAATAHPSSAPSRPGLPERPIFSFADALAQEEIVPGFVLPGDAEQEEETWSADMPEREQVARGQRIAERHRQRTAGDALGRQIGAVTDAWATNRSFDPGWIVPPHRNLGQLWTMTQEWVGPIAKATSDVPPNVALAWLDELTWRLERCLLPMDDDLSSACARVLTHVGGVGDGGGADDLRALERRLGSRWLGVAGRLLRHHREACADAAFDSLADRLIGLADLAPDLADRVAHERVLAFLDRGRQIEAERTIRDWKPSGDPAWLGRRVGVLAEIDASAASAAAADLLGRVRSGLTSLRDPYRRIFWLSREAMALMLIRSIGERRSSRDLEASARFVEIGQAGCDPRADLDALSHSLARPPGILEETNLARRFSDDIPLRLKARQLRRAFEDLGQPVALIGITTAAATGVRRCVPWLAAHDADGALRAFVRLRRDLTSDGFAGTWLARASQAVVEELADAACSFLERMPQLPPPSPDRQGADPDLMTRYGGYQGPVRHEQARAAMLHARVLLPRLEEAQVLRLVDACLDLRATWRKDGEWQTWGEAGRTAREALESIPNERRGERLLAVVRQPMAGRDVEVVNGYGDEADAIFPLLVHAKDGERRDASWDATVADLLEVLASTSARRIKAQAVRRLWALHTRGILTPEERSRFRDAVWGSALSESPRGLDGPNAGTGNIAVMLAVVQAYPLPPWTLLFIPEPSEVNVHRMVRTLLSHVPLPSFRGDGEDVWTSKPDGYHDPISQVLMSTNRPWLPEGRRLSAFEWSPEAVDRILGNIEAWWTNEGPPFLRYLLRETATPFPLPRWRTTTIVEFLAYVALPACSARTDILRRCLTLAEGLQEGGISVDLLVPMRVAAGMTTLADAAALLREASSALDLGRSSAFLNAVLLWMCMAERSVLPPLPTDFVGEVAGAIRSRRSPDLAWTLQVARTLVSRSGEPWTGTMLPDLAIGLQHLALETRPTARAASLALQPFDVMTIREEAASLLECLAPWLPTGNATARAWLDDADAEPFIPVRRRLVSARSRLGSAF